MTAEARVLEFQRIAQILQDSAHKVRDGINKVIEPEVKQARLAAHDSQRMLCVLSRRITILFGLSAAMNAATLIILLRYVN